MFHNDPDENGVLEPPKYDMITVQFRGDNHIVNLPYCEVANGNIKEIKEDSLLISGTVKDGVIDTTKVSFKEFTALVETTFDIKEVIKLSVQKAESYEVYTIL
jgi:type 1 fimbria pilin